MCGNPGFPKKNRLNGISLKQYQEQEASVFYKELKYNIPDMKEHAGEGVE